MNKAKLIALRLDEDLYNKAVMAASLYNISFSAYIRRCITSEIVQDEKLQSYEKDPFRSLGDLFN